MKLNKNILAGSLSFALISAMCALQACGKSDQVRTTALRAMDSGGAIPAGKSVRAVNAALIGSYVYNQADCRAKSDGTLMPSLEDSESGPESLQINDTSVVWSVSDTNGCLVVSTFQILGVDATTIALGNRQLAITKDNQIATQADCGSIIQPADPATGRWGFRYLLKDGILSRLQLPTPPCDAQDDENDFLYFRQ